MAENTTNTAAGWVDSIDIRSDGVTDTLKEEMKLKDSLKKDLSALWVKKNEWKITEAEYNRYANAAKAIFEKNAIIDTIKREYLEERNKTLRKSNTLLENLSLDIKNTARATSDTASNVKMTLKQAFNPGEDLQAYDDERGAYLVNIKEFEKQLSKTSIEDLNPLALKNYLIYLNNNKGLNRAILEQKFWWSERLRDFSILWGKRMQDEVHARNSFQNGKELLVKAATTLIWSGLFNSIEADVEKVLKDVLIENIKNAWKEREVFDDEKYREKTTEELDKKLEKMNYEKIMEELNDKFHGKNTNSRTIQEFFRKKNTEDIKKIKELEAAQKKAVTGMTVSNTLESCQIPKDFFGNNIGIKKIDELTPDEKQKLVQTLQVSGNGIRWGIKVFVDTQSQIHERQQMIRDRGGFVESPAKSEMVAKQINNDKNKTKEESLFWLKKTGYIIAIDDKNREKMKTQSASGKYQETFNKIGYQGANIEEICKDKKTIQKVLHLLEQKNLQLTELYLDLSARLESKQNMANRYVMVRDNITEDEFASRKSQGLISDAFADELFQKDVKQKKTTDFTVVIGQLEEREYTMNMKSSRIHSEISEQLSSLRRDGQSIMLDEVRWDKCFVKKEGGDFVVSINGKETRCSSDVEVKNTIDAYNFFCDIGLRSVAPSMESFLGTLKSTDSTYPDFDVQKWFDAEEQKILLWVVDKIFGLGMEKNMSAKSVQALKTDFSSKLNIFVEQKRGFDTGLMDKGILTQYRTFSKEGLRRLLLGRGETLQQVS